MYRLYKITYRYKDFADDHPMTMYFIAKNEDEVKEKSEFYKGSLKAAQEYNAEVQINEVKWIEEEFLIENGIDFNINFTKR